MRVRSFGAAVCVLVAACNPLAVLDNVSQVSKPGVLVSVKGARAQITVPDTVMHGVPFRFQVITLDVECAVRVDRTDVSARASDTIEVAPYDIVGTLAIGCGGDVGHVLVHADSLTFANPGRAVIRIVGDSAEDLSSVLRSPTSVTIPIIVR